MLKGIFAVLFAVTTLFIVPVGWFVNYYILIELGASSALFTLYWVYTGLLITVISFYALVKIL